MGMICSKCNKEFQQLVQEKFCIDCLYTKDIKTLFKVFHDSGFQCYLVGGAVRDYFIGRSVHDYDFTTDAQPEEMQQLFKKTIYTNKFGTVTIFVGKSQFEVTTFRTEILSSVGH